MDMGPTQVENGTFLSAYLHSWTGETEPIEDTIEDAHRASCLGLVHWASQPNKSSIYLVTQSMDGPHLSTDDGDGYPGILWHIRLINAAAYSILASPPPAPPPPDEDQPEDDGRKDRAGEPPNPRELFRARERLLRGLQGSTSQSGTTGPTNQSSSTILQAGPANQSSSLSSLSPRGRPWLPAGDATSDVPPATEDTPPCGPACPGHGCPHLLRPLPVPSPTAGAVPSPNTTPSPTVPQHNLGVDPDSVHTHDPCQKINLPSGFIDPAAHVEVDVYFGEMCSSDDDSDGFVPPRSPPDSPVPPHLPPHLLTCIPVYRAGILWSTTPHGLHPAALHL